MATNTTKTGSRKSDKETGFNQIEFMLIAAILKYNSSEQYKLTLEDIIAQLSDLSGKDHSKKTVRERLDYFDTISKIADDNFPKLNIPANKKNDALYNMDQQDAQSRITALCYLMGGTIKRTQINQRNEYAYYFEPFLTESDFNLIKGATTSSRYIRDDENRYLNKLLRFLYPRVTQANDPSISPFSEYNFGKEKILPKRPAKKRENNKAAIVLETINTIYDAFVSNKQIQINYGRYEEENNAFRLIPQYDSPRSLNPYAMLWNNGEYYLVATNDHDESEKILHFRIDRIITIQITDQKRECRPKSLTPFFDQRGHFKQQLYRCKHPSMSYTIPEEETADDTSYYLHCTRSSLATIIDNFGENNLIIGRTNWAKKEFDNLPFEESGEPCYTVKISNVDYRSMKRFCLKVQNNICLLAPESLRADIVKTLEEKINQYNSFTRKTQS